MQRSAPIPSAPAPAKPTRRRSAPWVVAAFVGIIIAVPVVTWWLLGFDSEVRLGADPTLDPSQYDYLFHPPTISPGLEQAAGVVATIVLAVSTIALTVAVRHRRFDHRWWPSLTGPVIAGIIAGVGERVVTAPVIGANIGGGMVLLFGTPIVIVLVLGSLLWSAHVFRSTVPDTSRCT